MQKAILLRDIVHKATLVLARVDARAIYKRSSGVVGKHRLVAEGVSLLDPSTGHFQRPPLLSFDSGLWAVMGADGTHYEFLYSASSEQL